MKRNLALILASVLLAFALTACGTGNQNNDTNGNGATNGTADTGAANNSGNPTNGGAASGSTDGITNKSSNSSISGSTDGGAPAKQSNRTGGATYGQMLRNGQSRDDDGFLQDMENISRDFH